MAGSDKPNKLVAAPDLAYFGALIQQGALLSMNSHALGTLESFNSTEQSASASINYKRVVNGKSVDYPKVAGCPVVTLQGGGGRLTFPHAAGDPCLIFFNDVDMDNFISSGNKGAPPNSARLHSFSDAIILVGVNSFPAALASYFTDGVQLAYSTTAVELTDKIKLYNQMTDLKTLVNGLIDLIAAITVTCATPGNPSSVPINAVAITAYKTQFAELLK